jgi:hypothetical protein
MTDPTGSAGRGRLAEVLATRGGRAEPEAPFVIEHREARIYMLCQAAELEHGIMCQYLFAAFSLKQSIAEGLTPEELEAVAGATRSPASPPRRCHSGRPTTSLLARVATFPQDVASIVQVLRQDYELIGAAWHAIGRPRSQVRLSARAFDTRTPQQRAQQFGFRLGPNDFDDHKFVHATTLCGEAEGLIVVEPSGLSR